MRKTKIVATIGPKSMDYNMLKKLAQNGMNVVRINLSHAKLEETEMVLQSVKRIRKELNISLPFMLDTRGPEVRVKTFKNGSVKIKRGQTFIFTGRNVEGDENQVSFNMPDIVKCIKAGNKILAVNGLITFKVVEVKGKDVITRAVNSGVLSNRKSLCIPGVKYSTPYLNEEDKTDILWGIKNDVELLAASFVNSKEDIEILRKFIKDNGGDLKIISKIESAYGVKNLDEIISVSDGIMVARGDLGVEVPVERLPDIQKDMIKKAVSAGKFVITATEMLESMITNNRPTRAEVSDVANAVYDGTSAVMLSGESAAGAFPAEAVKTMAKIAEETEKHINYAKRFATTTCKLNNTTDVISHSAVDASFMQNTKAIVVFTSFGSSAKMISRFRPRVPIIAVTPYEKTYNYLGVLWGVKAIKSKLHNTMDEMFKMANEIVKANGIAKVGDNIVITCGVPKKSGSTNLLKIDEVY